MAKKRTGRYEDNPAVITGQPRVRSERVRMTPEEFGQRYYPLSPITAPAGSVVVVTLTGDEMRYIIELPRVLIHNGYCNDSGVPPSS